MLRAMSDEEQEEPLTPPRGRSRKSASSGSENREATRRGHGAPHVWAAADTFFNELCNDLVAAVTASHSYWHELTKPGVELAHQVAQFRAASPFKTYVLLRPHIDAGFERFVAFG